MSEYLEYDGKLLHWRNPRDGSPEASYKATSGLPGHQVPAEQCVVDTGPVPAGSYSVRFSRRVEPAQPDPAFECGLKPGTGLQYIARGGSCEPTYSLWGNNRVRFVAADLHTKHACPQPRDGFYLHDSTKGYSHGCIEVEVAFFNRLYLYILVATTRQLLLRVAYAHRITNGGTRV